MLTKLRKVGEASVEEAHMFAIHEHFFQDAVVGNRKLIIGPNFWKTFYGMREDYTPAWILSEYAPLKDLTYPVVLRELGGIQVAYLSLGHVYQLMKRDEVPKDSNGRALAQYAFTTTLDDRAMCLMWVEARADLLFIEATSVKSRLIMPPESRVWRQ